MNLNELILIILESLDFSIEDTILADQKDKLLNEANDKTDKEGNSFIKTVIKNSSKDFFRLKLAPCVCKHKIYKYSKLLLYLKTLLVLSILVV